jgi:beta-glucanase (GH16 family)
MGGMLRSFVTHRRRRASVCAVVVAALLAGCAAPGVRPRSTNTLFRDDFNRTSLSRAWYPNRWFAARCSLGATRGELQYYTGSNVHVGLGMLALYASKTSTRCTEGSWSGTKAYRAGWVQSGGARAGGVSRKPGFTFRYGRIDVRFREPSGRGLWPAIWLLSDQSQRYPSRPEIDILESYGNPRTWSFHVHLNGSINSGRDITGPDTSKGFHTVSLDWRPRKITWFIDGRAAHSYTGPNIPNVPMYLVMNLATGGVAGTPPSGSTPAALLIDYVRVSR